MGEVTTLINHPNQLTITTFKIPTTNLKSTWLLSPYELLLKADNIKRQSFHIDLIVFATYITKLLSMKNSHQKFNLSSDSNISSISFW